MLSKFKKEKKKKKTYTTCKLLHKRKAQSLRKMQQYCPIQIMHSNGENIKEKKKKKKKKRKNKKKLKKLFYEKVMRL